jgi:hypothetical protein
MNPLPADKTCPVDLDFAEPHPVQLDLDVIVRRGTTIRRRRRIARAGEAVVACAAAASIVVGARGASFRWFPPAATSAPAIPAKPIDAQVAEDPPVTGKLTLLSSFPPNWITVAWATRRGEVCWATYRTPMNGGTEDVQCPGWSGADVPGIGRQDLSIPLVSTLPEQPDGGLVPAFGLVTPRATRVTLTFFGHRFSAAVVPVPLGSGKTVGVYLIWLRVPASASGYGSGDIQGATASDAAGRIVARHGPWN